MLIRNCQNSTGTQIEFRAKGTEDLASVTGFALSDVVMVNGRPTGLSGSGAEYILTYEPLSDFQGEVTVLVPFGVAQDTQRSGQQSGELHRGRGLAGSAGGDHGSGGRGGDRSIPGTAGV